MRTYESIFVLQPDLDDAQVDNGIENLKKTIEKYGGEVLKIERWGKKRLAYPIKKHKYGHYELVYFSGASETISELDRYCKLNEDVIRHLVVQTRKGFKIEEPSAPPEEDAQEEESSSEDRVEEGV